MVKTSVRGKMAIVPNTPTGECLMRFPLPKFSKPLETESNKLSKLSNGKMSTSLTIIISS